jgi:glyoxylase-like metal-dependent hydrolase (beta-lactamase superfamily II)
MGKTAKRLSMAVLILIGIIGIAYYWLLIGHTSSSDGAYRIDLAELRRLANSDPGQKATEVRVEHIASFTVPAFGAIAGQGWAKTEMPIYSYQLMFPDQSVIIDTGQTAAQTKANENSSYFDAKAFARMSDALTAARTIVLTHEHIDHMGGFVGQENLSAILHKTFLTKAQTASKADGVASIPAQLLSTAKLVSLDRPVVIAPGVVVVAAPGHTLGSQMVYVQLANGREFLFTGDPAPKLASITLQRPRTRLVSRFFLHEDVPAVAAQLSALLSTIKNNPDLIVVPGHDGSAIADLQSKKLLLVHFR